MKKSGKKNNHFVISHPNILPRTFGQRAADRLTQIAGSWGFIMGFLLFLILWILLDVVWLTKQSEEAYPFILLNLVLSTLAALQAPIILMSQNRQAQKDRQRAEYDYAVNRKSEKEILEIKKVVEKIEKKLR
jgi:uncharacterized membrane protein